MSNYGADSIKSLTFVEGVRDKVGMYLGSADNDGVVHGLIEIVNNSLDEVIMGYGNKINITVGKDWYSVEDFGRGIPFGSNGVVDDVLVEMLTTSHSGGKFDAENYSRVRGLHGVGLGVVSASSDNLTVQSYRDGKHYSIETIKGLPEKGILKTSKRANGTIVKAYPSQEVFAAETIKLDFGKISELIKEYAYFSPNCEFNLKNEVTGKSVKYHYKNGLKDFAKDMIKDPLHSDYIYYLVEEDNIEVEVIAKWTKGKEQIHTFVNGGDTPEGGTPTTGLKSAITTRINSETGLKMDGDTIRKGLVAIISIKHPNPLFGNQTKTKISNPELRGLTSKAILNGLDDFKSSKAKEYETLLEMIIKTNKAEEAAEEAREKVMSTDREIEKINKTRRGFDLPEKALDATNKTGYRELYVSEGDSASGFLKKNRDAKTQGIMPLRGKILNTFDLDLSEAYENEEVKAIFTLIGTGGGSSFNIKKMKYDKVIIAADGDPDGNVNCL